MPELCREHGISSATFYKWRNKFGGMDASMVSQLKELQDENRRLKKMYADLGLEPFDFHFGNVGHSGLLAKSCQAEQLGRTILP